MSELWDVYTIDRKLIGKTCIRGEQGKLADDDETKWIVIPCDENGTVRSDIKIPSRDEIYAQIAFQEQFYSGVLVGI
ncbi:hypothetical protein NXH67_03570 [Butyrivibrio sp. DSM 10294]|uniref:hypothetical protein n=1 Tax=Butyrivibrio sp. DSM 10294 TaxID=2972457 RepID=UPI00234F8DEF|nr:hypothetical protein [Butyrivibrio sp. DSM 10294]MDC7292592.1 hypothetical protein [Butyrivibrio sp. DSM 10294]